MMHKTLQRNPRCAKASSCVALQPNMEQQRPSWFTTVNESNCARMEGVPVLWRGFRGAIDTPAEPKPMVKLKSVEIP